MSYQTPTGPPAEVAPPAPQAACLQELLKPEPQAVPSPHPVQAPCPTEPAPHVPTVPWPTFLNLTSPRPSQLLVRAVPAECLPGPGGAAGAWQMLEKYLHHELLSPSRAGGRAGRRAVRPRAQLCPVQPSAGFSWPLFCRCFGGRCVNLLSFMIRRQWWVSPALQLFPF